MSSPSSIEADARAIARAVARSLPHRREPLRLVMLRAPDARTAGLLQVRVAEVLEQEGWGQVNVEVEVEQGGPCRLVAIEVASRARRLSGEA